jgi:hypothetical protein
MSLRRSHLVIIWGWLIAVAGLFAVRLVMGVPPSFTDVFAALVLGCVPAVVFMRVFRGSPQTVAQLLYDTEQAPPSSAPSSSRAARRR